MPYNPRTYSDYRNGLSEGSNPDSVVNDNSVYSTYTPFVGNNYEDYASNFSQYMLFLQENYNSNNPDSLIRQGVPQGTIIYDNLRKGLVVVDADGFGNLFIEPNSISLASGDLIPSAANSFSIGKQDKRWDNVYVDFLQSININVRKSDGDYIPVQETFQIGSDDIEHVGFNFQGSDVTSILNDITPNTAPPIELSYINEDISGVILDDNKTIIYIGSIPHSIDFSTDTPDTENITFGVIATPSTPLTLNMDSSVDGVFLGAGRSIEIVGGCSITRIISNESILWVVSGDYNVI